MITSTFFLHNKYVINTHNVAIALLTNDVINRSKSDKQ